MKEIKAAKAPAAVGAYSQAIQTDAGTIYVSGQLPIDPVTGDFAGTDIRSQTEQSLKNIQAILESAGLSMENVVKTTVFLRDIADFPAMNEVYSTYFSGTCPARAAFAGAIMVKDALVEIEAVAVKE